MDIGHRTVAICADHVKLYSLTIEAAPKVYKREEEFMFGRAGAILYALPGLYAKVFKLQHSRKTRLNFKARLNSLKTSV